MMAENGKKRKAPVRAAYLFPAYDLGAAIQVAEAVESDGAGQLSEATLAINIGVSAKSSGFKLKCLTARQFGLLTKQGERLLTTPLAKAILKPRNEAEKTASLLEAFQQLPLFKAVSTRFRGQPLPSGQTFRNILEREFALEQARVSTAERVLMDSARDAGALQSSGGNTYLVVDQPPSPSPQPSPHSPMVQASNLQQEHATNEVPRGQEVRLPAPAPHGEGGGGILVSEQDLATFEDDKEFDEVWRALGKVFRARGRRQLEERGFRQDNVQIDDDLK